jgi:hypothetical protein
MERTGRWVDLMRVIYRRPQGLWSHASGRFFLACCFLGAAVGAAHVVRVAGANEPMVNEWSKFIVGNSTINSSFRGAT